MFNLCRRLIKLRRSFIKPRHSFIKLRHGLKNLNDYSVKMVVWKGDLIIFMIKKEGMSK